MALGAQREAQQLLEDALAIAEQTADEHLIARCLGVLGEIAHDDGRIDDARTYHVAALDRQRRLGDSVFMANTLMRLGEIARTTHGLAEAQSLFEQSVELFDRSGVRQGRAAVLYFLGLVNLAREDVAAAIHPITESFRISADIGYAPGVGCCLDALAAVAVVQGDGVAAAKLLGAASAVRRDLDETLPPSAEEVRTNAEADARALAPALFEDALSDGQTLSPADAVRLVSPQ